MYWIRFIIFLMVSLYSQVTLALTFPHSCEKGQTFTLAAVGDILLHRPLQYVGLQKGFSSLWETALPIFQSVDMTYGNLEGPINANNNMGSGFPLFGYPNSLAASLKNSGFSIVSTANNHALDQGPRGIDNTINALNNVSLPFVGTRARNSTQPFFYITSTNHFNIAWIACAEHTNGIADPYHQVLSCYRSKDRQWIMDTISNFKNKVDLIIVTPHWGEEYAYLPNQAQKQFAHAVLDQGADVVLGSHPHVLQPFEEYVTKNGRTTAIMYSLGNFVSFQGSANNRTSIILLLGFTKNNRGTFINGIRFVPIYMQNRNGFHQMSLMRISNDHSIPYQIVTRALPISHVLYSNKMITNPECQ